ncbi:MAG: hypothetical protein ACLFSB_01645 [Chitinispirillaceae bacterium]
MKKRITCILLVFLGLIGCTEFPNSYNRVNADMIRTLDFMYEPAEAVPGDTVTMTAVFAGRQFEIDEIDWSISFDVISNNYGIDTAYNLQPLPEVPVESSSSFSSNTQCVVKKFVVPEDVIRNSPAIPRNWLADIPEEFAGSIPEWVYSLQKDSVISMIETLTEKADEWNEYLQDSTHTEETLAASDPLFSLYVNRINHLLPELLQIFTAPMRIFADLPGAHRIKSDYWVRYNRQLIDLPGSMLYENTNPVIDSISVYKVAEENLFSFDPDDDSYSYERIRLLGPGDEQWDGVPVNVIVDEGYSYFITCHNQPPDSLITMDSAIVNGGKSEEKLNPQWYFQLSENEIEKLNVTEYMNIVDIGNLIAALYPSTDERISTATIWLKLSDYMINENRHPVASTLKEVLVSFTYTQAYLDSKEKK